MSSDINSKTHIETQKSKYSQNNLEKCYQSWWTDSKFQNQYNTTWLWSSKNIASAKIRREKKKQQEYLDDPQSKENWRDNCDIC